MEIFRLSKTRDPEGKIDKFCFLPSWFTPQTLNGVCLCLCICCCLCLFFEKLRMAKAVFSPLSSLSRHWIVFVFLGSLFFVFVLALVYVFVLSFEKVRMTKAVFSRLGSLGGLNNLCLCLCMCLRLCICLCFCICLCLILWEGENDKGCFLPSWLTPRTPNGATRHVQRSSCLKNKNVKV